MKSAIPSEGPIRTSWPALRNPCWANQIEYQYVCSQRDDDERLPTICFDGEQPRSGSDAKLPEPTNIQPAPRVAGFLERSFERSHCGHRLELQPYVVGIGSYY